MTPSQKTTAKRYLIAGAAYAVLVAGAFGVLGTCSTVEAQQPADITILYR